MLVAAFRLGSRGCVCRSSSASWYLHLSHEPAIHRQISDMNSIAKSLQPRREIIRRECRCNETDIILYIRRFRGRALAVHSRIGKRYLDRLADADESSASRRKFRLLRHARALVYPAPPRLLRERSSERVRRNYNTFLVHAPGLFRSQSAGTRTRCLRIIALTRLRRGILGVGRLEKKDKKNYTRNSLRTTLFGLLLVSQSRRNSYRHR